MRWNLPPDPKLGEVRFRKKFAWVPTETSDRVKVWLERYIIVERYECGFGHCYWTSKKTYDMPTFIAHRLKGTLFNNS